MILHTAAHYEGPPFKRAACGTCPPPMQSQQIAGIATDKSMWLLLAAAVAAGVALFGFREKPKASSLRGRRRQ
jgi:hypothetical protein